MGTSNFCRTNASKMFAICMDYEDEFLDDDFNPTGETEMRRCELYEYLEMLEFVREQMKDAAAKTPDIEYDFYNWVKESNDRNFPEKYIGSFRMIKILGDIECIFYIHVFSVSGYYEGACLDWRIEIDIFNDELDGDSSDEIASTIIDNASWSNLNKGLVTIFANRMQREYDKVIRDRLVNTLENVFESVSMPLNVVGRFSNGETIYEKAK